MNARRSVLDRERALVKRLEYARKRDDLEGMMLLNIRGRGWNTDGAVWVTLQVWVCRY